MKTTANINWDEVEEKFNYIAQDEDGSIWAYTEKPVAYFQAWKPADNVTLAYGLSHRELASRQIEGDVENWATTLVERPEQEVVEAPKPLGHKHAQQMLEYAQDALNSEYPWKNWEYLDTSGIWNSLEAHPVWTGVGYRRKIRTVTVEIPEELARDFVELKAFGGDWRITKMQSLVQKGIETL